MTDKNFIPRSQRKLREAMDLFHDILMSRNWDRKLILSKRRDRELVDRRQIIAKRLRSEGYSYPLIAKVMNRDHSSIMHLCRKRD